MSPYSGMVDMLESKNMLTKEGNSLVYKLVDGNVIKKFRKAWERNEDECLDKVMLEISSNVNPLLSTEVNDADIEDEIVSVNELVEQGTEE
jgi:hypothetical protein